MQRCCLVKYALRRSQTLSKACLSPRVYLCMHRLFESLRAALRRAAVSEGVPKSGQTLKIRDDMIVMWSCMCKLWTCF